MQQNSDSLIIASELLSAKLVELVIIFFFHLIVWYFIVSFVVKFKKRRKEFFHKDSGLYLTLSKLFVFIACGSGFLMFFIPSQGFRPSFLNLVYLIIASALLFRLQEVNGAYVINERGKLFLKMIGYAYLTVTIIFSLWGNYINYCHLQSILDRVKEARKQRSEIVLEVPPSLTSQNGIWFFGSGFHLVPLPISEEENYEINKTFSYYYGIKGIRIVK